MNINEINKKITDFIACDVRKTILPIYVLDGNEYIQQGTLSLVKYKESYFGLTAYHAIDGKNGMYAYDNIEKEFYNILQDFKLLTYPDIDLSIVVFNDETIPNKNYYDLNVNNRGDFRIEDFFWIGFPVKNTRKIYRKIHKTKNVSDIAENSIIKKGNDELYTHARYLLEQVIFKNEDEKYYLGDKDLKCPVYINNEEKMTEGTRPNFKGMSGGAFFIINRTHYNYLNGQDVKFYDKYYFVGLGIEYSETKKQVKGINRNIILSKLSSIIEQYRETQ